MRSKLFILSSLLLLLASCTQTYVVTFNGGTGGTVSDMGGEYDEGTTISVSAQPQTGYEFQGWSDGSMQNPRTITVSESLNLTALFTKQEFTVTVNIQGEGSVVDQNGNTPGTYEFGSSVILEALPNVGYNFTEWSDGNTQNPRTFNISEALTVSAIFTKLNYDLNISIIGNGEVVNQNGEVVNSIEFGQEIILTPKASEGYFFDGWELTFDIDDVISDNATFNALRQTLENHYNQFLSIYAANLSLKEPRTRSLKSIEDGIGDLNKNYLNRDGSDGFEEDVQFYSIRTVLRPFNQSLQTFNNWVLPIIGLTNFNVQANFKPLKSLYVVRAKEGGKVKINESDFSSLMVGIGDYGESISSSVQSNYGWNFSGWNGSIQSDKESIEFLLNSGLNDNYNEVIAYFNRVKFDLSIDIEGEGTVTEEVVVQPSQYDFESQVKLTATPEDLWEFSKWTGDIESTENPITISIDGQKDITAEFVKKDSDKDGVPDDIDKCPETPDGATVDGEGCPTDLNNDGVPDALEGDSDADGVIDFYDECSNTTVGAVVDSKGCAVIDQVFLFSGAVSTVVLNNNVSGTISFSIRNNLPGVIQLESLNVYDGDTGALKASSSKSTSPSLFPTLAPGQSHSLQATFNSFIYLPIYYWRFTYNGQSYEVSKTWSLTSGQTRPYKEGDNPQPGTTDTKVVQFRLINKED